MSDGTPGDAAEAPPAMYLCIALEPEKPDFIHDLPDDFLHGADQTALLTHQAVNSDRWHRTWFATRSREEAMLYQHRNPVVVVIPLNPQPIPLDEVP